MNNDYKSSTMNYIEQGGGGAGAKLVFQEITLIRSDTEEYKVEWWILNSDQIKVKSILKCRSGQTARLNTFKKGTQGHYQEG